MVYKSRLNSFPYLCSISLTYKTKMQLHAAGRYYAPGCAWCCIFVSNVGEMTY